MSGRYLNRWRSLKQALLDRIERRVDADDVPGAGERLRERRGLLDLPPDDRLDDLVELCGMRCREKHPRGLLQIEPCRRQAEVRNRAVRIEQIATRLVDAADRRPHLVVGMTAADDV